ncbi:putative glycogen debranching enzyme [Catalinimonas alkaloidigena]|uniref:amylo-alpha-1,6-glucosidase n=1 Tax=Catalinimonas alkaloidigena TaxID=1075417 RepID=UPI002406B739|nr:amylo-alpha-1,6-glucosidase [Catalinimonas alkaloidigena]MDF9795924.1 putative glycogen debranching enzyme [Catalinimonas alkaloidigena]
MSYIQFDKKQLVNLAYSLSKEVVRSNRSGAYASTTISGCNTRRYHGLLVAPQQKISGVHVIISTLDETVVCGNASFDLGVHKYPEVYSPKGYKYLRDFVAQPIPKSTFRLGEVVLTKEKLLVEHENRSLVRYVLEEAKEPVKLRLRPFLAFRNVHKLASANDEINQAYEHIAQGIKLCLYDGYDDLYMQTSKEPEFVAKPDWYYSVEYIEDMEMGMEFQEDLYVPGYFEVTMQKGETVIFTGGPDEVKTANLLRMFNTQTRKRTERNSFENCLKVAAAQFILTSKGKGKSRKNDRTDVIASYQLYRRGGRDAFIAIPGLTVSDDDNKAFKALLDTMLKDRKGPFFPFWEDTDSEATYEAMDAPLWFFWALQQYVKRTGDRAGVWKAYGKDMREILEAYRDGTDFNIKMQSNGLISGGVAGKALTWMNAFSGKKAVTPRIGMPVEINALWYNAVAFTLDIAGPRSTEGKKVIAEWTGVPEKIKGSFVETFWDEKKGYLADVVNGKEKDWSIRPNQVLALSLPFSALSEEMKGSVLKKIESELLTPRGLRSLSINDKQYQGKFFGDLEQRNKAYHQGMAWPWLAGHYVEALLEHKGRKALPQAYELYQGFESVMREHGLSTISEIYEGEEPYKACGAVSQAWNVAELIRMDKIIKDFDEVTQPLTI